MRQELKSILAGLLLASCAVFPVTVGFAASEGAGAERVGAARHVGGWPVASIIRAAYKADNDLWEVAWTQRIIRVGPGKSFDRWRCSVNVNGTVYYSTALTEMSARAKLATRTNKRPFCRRERRGFFFRFGFGF